MNIQSDNQSKSCFTRSLLTRRLRQMVLLGMVLLATLFSPISAMVAAVPLSAAPFSAAPEELGHVVLHSGSVLPSGEVVEFIKEARIDEAGNWAALVHPVGSVFPLGAVAVRNGVAVLGPGSVMAGGEVVGNIFKIDLGPGGVLAATWDQGGATFAALDQTVILRSGQAINAPNLPAGTVMEAIWSARVAAPFVMLQGLANVPGRGILRVSLYMDCSDLAAPILLQAFMEGDLIPGVGELFAGQDFRGSVSLTSNGAFAMEILVRNSPQGTAVAVMTESGVMAVAGLPAPSAGMNWDTYAPQLHTTGPGQVSLATPIRDTASLELFGAIFSPSGEVLRSGEAVPGAGHLTVSNFFTARMERNGLTGEIACLLPVQSPGSVQREVLWYADEILFDESSSTVSGELVNVYDMHLGGGGEMILLQANHPQWSQGILLIERSVGEATACSVAPNSTGVPGQLSGEGSSYAGANGLVLQATNLPSGQFGLLLNSQSSGFLANPGGSPGNLCLGGALGRFNSLVQASDAAGTIEFALDLTALPTPNLPVIATAGQTWFFQAWHRDLTPMGSSISNFTQALAVTFR